MTLTTKDYIDPELIALCEMTTDMQLTEESLESTRELLRQMELLEQDLPQGVERRTLQITGSDEAPLTSYLYLSPSKKQPYAALLNFHGGGYVMGSSAQNDARNIRIAADLGIAVLSVGYRLGPENPFPAGLNDGHRALRWLHENASSINVDPSRIAVGGDSAGGGMAASLVLSNRDGDNLAIAHQHLVYPMLDNLSSKSAAPHLGEFVWTRQANDFGWASYLGGAAPVSPAVPARNELFSDLPAAWIATGQFDLFCDENIRYAQQLMSAGVSTELQVYPAAVHGFTSMPSKIGDQFLQDYMRALASALQAVD